MSIPYWRSVDYTDEGCSIYECLNCYQKWEGRTDPELAEWMFCPYCGIKWKGQKEWDQAKKLDRKCGKNPSPNARLARPLFVIEEKFHPVNESWTEQEWHPISGSLSLIEAVLTLEYYAEKEANSELLIGYDGYRVVFRPYAKTSTPFREVDPKKQPLKWKEPLNQINKNDLIKVWKKYKAHVKTVNEKNRLLCESEKVI